MSDQGYVGLLKNRGFQAFLWTQFLGAFNDNVYKMVVSVLASPWRTRRGATDLVAGGRGFLSAVPAVFRLCGLPGGRVQQTNRPDCTKVLRDCWRCAAIAAFLSRRLEWMLAVLFLMATQSTFFSPAKYGVRP